VFAIGTMACTPEDSIRYHRPDGPLGTLIARLPTSLNGRPICYPPRAFEGADLDAVAAMPPEVVAAAYGKPCVLESEASIVLHVSPSGTDAPDPQSLTCDGIVTTGDIGAAYDVLVMVANADSLKALQIGLTCDDGVRVLSWVPMVDAMEIPVGSWPEPGSQLALAFRSCLVPQGPARLQLIGRLTVLAESPGTLRAADIGENLHGERLPALVSCDDRGSYWIRPCSLGAVAFGDDTGAAYNPCAGCLEDR
jgi:hypothetical protein